MTNYVKVGKIVNTQGLKGEVRVISETDFPDERFKVGSQLTIEMPKGELIDVTVKSHRLHKQFHLLSFENHPSINDVEKYKTALLKIREDAVSEDELLEDEFYYRDIIGLTVVTEENETVGKVKEIFETGANDVWVIQTPGKKDWYLPYIDDVVKEIDLENGEVHIHLMEGLMDEN